MRRFSSVFFAVFCLFSGSQWLFPWNDSPPAANLCSLALGATVAALVTGLSVRWFGQKAQIKDLLHWKLLFSGLGAIGVPALLLLLGREQFSSVMAVATQAGMPVVVAITFGAVQPGSELQNRLVPGLIALAGALLLLPVALPQSSRGWSGFLLYLAAVCLSGVSSVFCHREMMRLSHGVGLLVVVVANAGLLGVIAVVWLAVSAQWRSLYGFSAFQTVESVLVIALNIVAVAALLRLLPPTAASSRVVFSPLIATLEAFLFLRPTVSLRAACGALLMLLGGLACLRADREHRSTGTMCLR